MPALQFQQKQITLEQYEGLPSDVRAEVFDGILVNMAGPSRIHQRISTELTTIVNNYIRDNKGKCQVYHAPFDVVLSKEPLTVVQPDLMVICDLDKLDENRCNGAPDFIIEIVSPSNASDDYIRKLYYYKQFGVREYWIVDPMRKLVTVNYFEKDVFAVQYDFNSKVKVGIYGDLEVDFSEIINYTSNT